MAAHCGNCGKTVMPYRKYLFHFHASATCAACGRLVKLRGFRALVWAGVIGVAGAIAGTLLIDTVDLYLAFLGVLLVVFLALDWWSWQALSWDPADGSSSGTEVPPNTR